MNLGHSGKGQWCIRLFGGVFVSAVGLFVLNVGDLLGQVNILTANGDNNRTNANLNERLLRPAIIQPGTFGKLGAFPADGQIYSQPLYVSGLSFPDGTIHNVLFTSTMHNTVYAYDADLNSTDALLWQINLGPSVPSTMLYNGYSDISPEVGILGTGTIDLQAGVLYIVSESLQDSKPIFYLHALDLRTGVERMDGPVVITATVTGYGAESLGGQTVAFDPSQHIQRPGLLLANQVVYVAFGSHADESPWHGWVMSYDASDLRVQLGVFMTTPDGEGGAVWQSGHGLAADDAGNVYCISGNGDYDGSENFGESLIKLSGSGVALLDWFTPENWQMLSDNDSDLSAGPALIPGTHTIVGGDKYGQLYVINGDSMGELGSASSVGTQIFTGAVLGGMFNFAMWNRPDAPYVYAQGEQDVVKSYQIVGGVFDTTPVSVGALSVDVAQVGMTISADGSRNGVLWETTGDFNDPSTPGTLHAFDALNLANELWNSDMNPDQDSLGGFVKFVNPTVVNGKVYVATSTAGVVVYGLLCGGRRPVRRPDRFPDYFSTSMSIGGQRPELIFFELWPNAESECQ